MACTRQRRAPPPPLLRGGPPPPLRRGGRTRRRRQPSSPDTPPVATAILPRSRGRGTTRRVVEGALTRARRLAFRSHSSSSWPSLLARPVRSIPTGHNKKQIPSRRTARILVAIPAHRGAPSGGVRVAERGAVSAGRLAHDRRRLVSRQPAPSDAPAARGSKGCANGGQGSARDRPQRGNPDGHPWWSRGAPSLRSRLAPVSPDGAFAQTTAAGASEAPIFGLPGWRCSSTRHPLVSHKRRGAPGRARQGREKEARSAARRDREETKEARTAEGRTGTGEE